MDLKIVNYLEKKKKKNRTWAVQMPQNLNHVDTVGLWAQRLAAAPSDHQVLDTSPSRSLYYKRAQSSAPAIRINFSF